MDGRVARTVAGGEVSATTHRSSLPPSRIAESAVGEAIGLGLGLHRYLERERAADGIIRTFAAEGVVRLKAQ
jgi:hypothetical protein